jgi:hypothetical protein
MTALTLALCLGASLRLWRVFEIDVVGQPLRKLADKTPPKVGDFLACIWCLGFWLSLAVVASGYYWGDTAPWLVLSGSLSISWLLGQIHTRVEES